MRSNAGYQPLAQSADEEPEADVSDNLLPQPVPGGASTSAPSKMRSTTRPRPGPIDLTKLDNAFKRWTDSIAQKVKRKKKVTDDHERKEIWKSVFEPAVLPGSTSTWVIKTLDHGPPMTKEDFDIIEQGVRSAIAEGIHPKMITKGSSGSYFARAKVDGRVKTVAVFKPKDEEPYGAMNPKTTKWIHRQLRFIIPFGRACLIPNLSYISEVAASLLDRRLDLHIVPRTELVSLSSSAFFYDWIDRNAFKKGKPLPDKIGSMQYFLHGFTDASEFLRKHPWPGRSIADTFDDDTHRRPAGTMSRKICNTMKIVCGKTGSEEDDLDDFEDDQTLYDTPPGEDGQKPFYWTGALQRSFREELEKLVILDYLMLNTDRGADNYMIKYCEGDHEKQLIDTAPSRSATLEMPIMSELRRTEPMTVTGSSTAPPGLIVPNQASTSSRPNTPQNQPLGQSTRQQPHIHIAAIDNSLSFPWEHPKGWRSYTYGWLYLPVSIIGRPFSQKTRDHFLPLLTSKEWWEETTYELRKLFSVDPDFNLMMFNKQMSVIKGQGWNIVQSLRHADEGPLELTRRTKMLVHDDLVQIDVEPEETEDQEGFDVIGPLSASHASIHTMPLPPPRHQRSLSIGGNFPPPIQRVRSDAFGIARPVPFSSKFPGKVHPGTTGVTVLEHMERLDAVEASLQRLGLEDTDAASPENDEEDIGQQGGPSGSAPAIAVLSSSSASTPAPAAAMPTAISRRSSSGHSQPQFSPPGSPGGLPAVPEVDSLNASINMDMEASIGEEDLVAMSKSMSHVEPPATAGHDTHWSMFHHHQHTPSRHTQGRSLDFLRESTQTKTVVVERLETIEAAPLCSCW